jgi:hypothetical protein
MVVPNRPLAGAITERAIYRLSLCILSSHGTPESIWDAHAQGCFVPVRSAASTGFAFIVRPVWEGLGANVPPRPPARWGHQAAEFCRDVSVGGLLLC